MGVATAGRVLLVLLALAGSIGTGPAAAIVITPYPETRQESCWFRFDLTQREKREFAQMLQESDGSDASRVQLHRTFMSYCGGHYTMLNCIGLSRDLKECLRELR